MGRGIRTEPKPWCPVCGAKMRLKRPKSHQQWKAFWGCPEWPNCDGTRNVDPETGEPEMEEYGQ